ncbi:MAG: PLP-dependent cysteine synthase family protein [Andreesenia angusta]|nr:PLP-dependent cysteine synthase family protein [Andreesenia angusta]
MSRLKDIDKLIGNTPLVEISFKYKGKDLKIFSKLEYYNLAGSIKDRIAYYILNQAYQKGSIKPGDTIVEATSGNTGIAFCAIGARLGHPVIIYMPDWMSEERMNIIKSFGAEICLVSKEEGGFIGSIEKAEEYARTHKNVFLPRQFSNEDNTLGQYNGVGKEIIRDLKNIDLIPDAFIGGVGTGGTVMGVKKAFKEINPDAKIYPLEPLESPTLSTGNKVGNHRISGISDEFIPDILKLDELNRVVSIHDGDAILMSQKLAKSGLGVGISSGANFIGAVSVLEELGYDKTVTTVFADDNKKYLSTDLMNAELEKDEYISKYIEIVNIKAYRN